MADHNGYMPFPHTFSDNLMPLIGGSEWKVFHVVVRSTLGWTKIWDEISGSQFQKKTGLTRQTTWTALDNICGRGIIQSEETNRERIRYALIYPDIEYAEELVRNFNQLTGKEILRVRQELVRILDESYGKLVRILDIQKKGFKENKKKKAVSPQNLVVPTSDEEKMELWKANILKIHGVPHWDQKLQDRTYKLEAKIREAFGGDCCHANIEDHQLVLMQLMGYEEVGVLGVAGNRQTPGRTSQGIEWILNAMEKNDE